MMIVYTSFVTVCNKEKVNYKFCCLIITKHMYMACLQAVYTHLDKVWNCFRIS